MQVNCKVEALNLNVGSTWQRETMMNNRNGMYVTMLPESVKFCILSFLEGFHQRRMFFWMVPTRNPVFFLTGSNANLYFFDGFQCTPLCFWRVPTFSLIFLTGSNAISYFLTGSNAIPYFFWRVPTLSLIFFDGFQCNPLFFLTGSDSFIFFDGFQCNPLFFWRVAKKKLAGFHPMPRQNFGRFQCPSFLTGSNATNQKNWWVSMQPVKTFDGSSIPHIFWRVPIPSIKKFDGCQCNPSKLLTAFIAARQNFWRLPMRSVKHSIGNIAPKQKNKPTPCHHFFDGYRRRRSNVEIFLVHWKICATIFILEIQAPKLPCRTQIFANKLISSAFLQPFCKTSCSSNCSVLGAPLIFWWFSTLILSNSCP